MKTLLLTIYIAVLGFIVLSAAGAAQSIYTKNAICSGVRVGEAVLTAKHCIEGTDEVYLDGTSEKLDQIQRLAGMDVAVLRGPIYGFNFSRFANSDHLGVNESVVIECNGRPELSIVRGTVIGWVDTPANLTKRSLVIKNIDEPGPGCSGAAVVELHHRMIVGILWGGNDKGDNGEVSYATPSSAIAAALGLYTSTYTEIVKQQLKADSDAKLAQGEAAKERTVQEKRAAVLEKERVDALTAWQQRVASAPFVLPVEGWVRATPQPNVASYVILPKTGLTTDCHFSWDGSKPVLDCLGAVGRNDYVSVQSNGRWYLLKSKWAGSGDYAGTVNHGGSTLCLRKAGCYHVLAEIRPQPTELPDKLEVPAPGSLTLTYGNDDFSFSYPQNWRTEEKKNKDNVLFSLNVAPAEAHLASWVTHGVFIGHVTKMSSKFPQTLVGAYDQFTTFERQRGLVVTDAKTVVPVGDSHGKIATYTAPSVFNAGESGWVVVVKDKSDGYYWVSMFYPSNDNSHLYAQAFDQMLKSFKWRK